MFKLNRNKRMGFPMTRSIKSICELPLIWYARSIIYKLWRHRTKELRQSKLLPPMRCPLVVSSCMMVSLLVGE